MSQRVLVDAYIRLKESDKAQLIAEKLIQVYPAEPSSFLEAAKTAYENNQKSNAIDYLLKAKELITNKTTVSDIGEIGDAFFGFRLYQDAVACYEIIADPDQDTIFTYKLVNAYYYAGVLSKVLNTCKNIRNKYGIIGHFVKIEIWTLEEISDIPQEVELAKEYLKIFPDDIRVKIKLAQVSYLLEDYKTTDEIISEDFDLNKLPLDVGIVISSLLASRNKLHKSFNLMYELRRKYFHKADIHSFYQANFYLKNKETSDWLQKDVVDIDTAVTVEGVDGKTRWFVIEDREEHDFGKDEFNINHPIIVDMLGKKVGD